MFEQIPNPAKINGIYTFFTRETGRKFWFSGESHPFWEMVYVISGRVGITADERVYMLSEGEIVFHKPMEFHRIWSVGGITPVFHVISFLAEGSLMKSLENKAVKCDDKMKELVENMIKCGNDGFAFRDGDKVVSVKDEISAFECIKSLEMLICLSATSKDNVETAPENDATTFSKAVNFMQDRISEHLTVSEIASGCFVSESKLKKIFAKFVDCGVAEYFTFLKIKSACRLFERGENIGSVGEKLGFSNRFYFSSVFKKVMGTTPGKYIKGK